MTFLCLTVSTGVHAVEEPAIHWETDSVDLRADSLELEFFGETLSPEGAEVAITEGQSGKRRWYVGVRWADGEQDHALVLNLRHNETDWHLDTINWWIDDPAASDERGRYGSAAFNARNPTRTPLGQAFIGDLQRHGNQALWSCKDDGLSLVKSSAGGGTLSIEGLHLEVIPRERSLYERALRFIGLGNELEQNHRLLAEECPESDKNWTSDIERLRIEPRDE